MLLILALEHAHLIVQVFNLVLKDLNIVGGIPVGVLDLGACAFGPCLLHLEEFDLFLELLYGCLEYRVLVSQ